MIVRIDEAVQLHRDPALRRSLAPDQLEQPRAHPARRDEQRPKLLLSAVAGEQVE